MTQKTLFASLCLLLFATVTHVVRAEERLWLVRDGQAATHIVFGNENRFAAERLQQYLESQTGVKVPMVVADAWTSSETQDSKDSNKGSVLLIGSNESNPVLRKLAEQIGLKLDRVELTDQGYVAKRVVHEGRDWLILAGGGRDGAQYAVVDLFQWNLQHDDRNVWLDSLDTHQVPKFRYRWLWNWDNRMDWGGAGELGVRMAAGDKTNRYTKNPDAFLVDGKHCIDFMADHKFNGMILWGFLRDNHGGIAASQELCRYAAYRGVRILPGVGTSGYTGYYYEGKNEFNGDTWLAMHPELRAIDKDGKPHNVPCPSKKINQEWLDRGAHWLFKNFEVGGVNLEMGDFFVCFCDECKRARGAIESSEPDYYKDMAISHMVTLKTMRQIAPDAWLSYATYTGYTAEMMQTPPKFLAMIPEDAICQWTLSGMAKKWDPALRPMARHNLGYLHWCNVPSGTANRFYLTEVQKICQQAAAAGFEGLDTYGELSNERPNAEIAYWAWEAFLWKPEMTVNEFVEQRLARRYGGPKAASTLLEIIPLVHAAQQPPKRNPTEQEEKDRQQKRKESIVHAVALAQSAREAAASDGKARWDRLLTFLSALKP